DPRITRLRGFADADRCDAAMFDRDANRTRPAFGQQDPVHPETRRMVHGSISLSARTARIVGKSRSFFPRRILDADFMRHALATCEPDDAGAEPGRPRARAR